MRENFNLNKRKREEAKKKKRDEKIARRLSLKAGVASSDSLPPEQTLSDPTPETTP